MKELTDIAAVDLGSNSFRLQIGRVVDAQVYAVDSLREPVRLAAGLSRDGWLDEAAQARAVDALRRFSQRLRGFPAHAVRAVGTNTLRAATNASEVLERLGSALGFPIEVVAGREEARLIYLGVAHGLSTSAQKQLVVDIGGGSTEFIIGAGLSPHVMESLDMGCVSYSLQYFPDQRLTKSNMKRAETAARIEIEAIRKQFSSMNWEKAVGSSGSASAISDVLVACGWSVAGITVEGLAQLRLALLDAGHLAKVDLPGLRGDRLPVLPGGLAIMTAVFDELGIKEMEIASGAMRQGILWDMVGRTKQKDMRELTVRQFMKRYHVDAVHAHLVERLARKIWRALSLGESDQPEAMLLSWATRLHEIGLSVAHAGYHKHSAYIVANADMPGFSKMEQQHVSMLIRFHRGSLEKLTGPAAGKTDWALLVALRLAVLMYRSRSAIRMPRMNLEKRHRTFTIDMDAPWLRNHPLTAAELRDEIAEWGKLGVKLVVPSLSIDDEVSQ